MSGNNYSFFIFFSFNSTKCNKKYNIDDMYINMIKQIGNFFFLYNNIYVLNIVKNVYFYWKILFSYYYLPNEIIWIKMFCLKYLINSLVIL